MADEAADLGCLLCARCAAELTPGRGSFYRVNIEAVADATPPVMTAEDPESIRKKIRQTIAEMEALSAREAMDQVHRRLTLYLCGPCFRQWIENPAG